MDPVTSPLIHKDSGRRARVDPGEPNSPPQDYRNPACPDRSERDDGPRDLSPDPQGFRPSGPASIRASRIPTANQFFRACF